MAEIVLTNGKVALVDEADAASLSQYRWRLGTGGYAERRDGKTWTRMHRQIIGAQPRQVVDHANGNRLDNRRANLRFASPFQNVANRRKADARTVSAFKGVAWHPNYCSWVAEIKIHGQRFNVRGARTETEAARAYDALAREFHGEFACVNFPRPGERGALERTGS